MIRVCCILLICLTPPLQAAKIRRGPRLYDLHDSFRKNEIVHIRKIGEEAVRELDNYFPGLSRRVLRIRLTPFRARGRNGDLYRAGGTSGNIILIQNCRLLLQQHRLRKTLTHELTHAALDGLGGSRLPLWLEEGTALLFAGQKPFKNRIPAHIDSPRKLSGAIRNAVRRGGFTAWRKLKPLYARARTMTILLAGRGYRRFVRFLTSIKRGRPLRTALQQFYNTTTGELWRKSE